MQATSYYVTRGWYLLYNSKLLQREYYKYFKKSNIWWSVPKENKIWTIRTDLFLNAQLYKNLINTWQTVYLIDWILIAHLKSCIILNIPVGHEKKATYYMFLIILYFCRDTQVSASPSAFPATLVLNFNLNWV